MQHILGWQKGAPELRMDTEDIEDRRGNPHSAYLGEAAIGIAKHAAVSPPRGHV